MQPFLTEHASEVENMLFTEWNWNDAMKIEREEGQIEGEKKRSIDIAKKLLSKSFSLNEIADITGLTVEQIQHL